jgi:cysteine desulfurase/selenocysteine lyase
MLGPTGIGVLYVRPEVLAQMEPVAGGGGMISVVQENTSEWAEPPWKFEAGTPPIAEAVALAAAVDYVDEIGWKAISRHEAELTAYALDALVRQPDVRLHGPVKGADRAGVLSFSVGEFHPHDVAQVLDQVGVAVRGGHHCCQVLMRRLGVQAVVRASLGLYSDETDVDRLIEGLGTVRRVLGQS